MRVKAPPLPMGLAVITVLKGMIGTGILGLPYVFARVNLALAAPGMLATAAVGAFSVWRLIECKDLLAGALLPGDSADSDDDGETLTSERSMMGLGPLAVVGWQSFGSAGVAVAAFGILASQLGFAVSYIDVIIETIGEPTLLGSIVSVESLRIGLCAILCGLCLLRRLKSLAWLSGVALFIYAYLLVALIYFGGGELAVGGEARGAWVPVRWRNFGGWFGTAIFAQEAIVISQYVYDDMRLADRREYLPVLLSSFGISGTLFTFVGAFGYLSYGDKVQNVFYLNFPADSMAVTVGEVVLCIVLMFTFALQMYPVMSFLEATALGLEPGWDLNEPSPRKAAPSAQKRYGTDRLEEEDSETASGDSAWRPLAALDGDEDSASEEGQGAIVARAAALRCTMVAATCVAAALVPNLACVSGYSGCFAMSAIGFFMPSLCHIRLNSGRLSLSQWLGDILLLLAGCSALVFGVSSTSC